MPMLIGSMLRRWRRAEDLTLQDVSRQTKIPVSTLQQLETGRSEVSGDTMVKLLSWMFSENKAVAGVEAGNGKKKTSAVSRGTSAES